MAQRIKNIKDLKWFDIYPPLEEKKLFLLKDFPFKLPKLFIELLKISDGGSIDYNFDYHDEHFHEILSGSISQIYGICTENSKMLNRAYDPLGMGYKSKEYFINYNNIIDQYNHSPEGFLESLVIFGVDGGGNRACFDYRADPKTDNPPIVYWIIGYDVGEDISFLANNFEEFLGILKEPEDDDF